MRVYDAAIVFTSPETLNKSNNASVRVSNNAPTATELAAALRAMHASLEAQGYGELASGRLVDAIRRVNAFGLQLCPLDVRQESTRHANAVDALRAFAGVGARGSYAALDDDAKVAWLADELETGRPLLRRGDFEKLVDGDFVEDAGKGKEKIAMDLVILHEA